jgi:hypothetical protein
MAINSECFDGPGAATHYLAARGFDPRTGARSGGIVSPRRVALPAGARLVRLFHDPTRQFGAWWATPWELEQIVAHFARGGPAFDEGRAQGRGLLHATLAVRHEWSGHSADHLGRFVLVALKQALEAYHGEGDVAPDGDHRHTLKPVGIVVGQRMRRACQLYLPECHRHLGAFEVLQTGWTGSGLIAALRGTGAAALPFES